MRKIMQALRFLLNDIASILTIIPFIISVGLLDFEISKAIVGRLVTIVELHD